MSDLLAPILVVMENEVDAFWCFSAFIHMMVCLSACLPVCVCLSCSGLSLHIQKCFQHSIQQGLTTAKQQHTFNGPLSGTTRMSWYQKGKTSLDLLEQELVSGSGISCTMCNFAPCPRQITMPTTQFFTGQMPFLPPSQQLKAWQQGLNR